MDVRRESTTDSSESSTARPLVVRRRVSSDGSFIGCRLRRRDRSCLPSPREYATDEEDFHCGESLFDVSLTSQQRPGADSGFSGSGNSKSTLAEDPNTVEEETYCDESRRPTGRCNASDTTGDGQLDSVSDLSVASETSEQRDMSGTDTGCSSDREISESAEARSESGTDVHKEPFLRFSVSMIELDVAYEKATEALDKERKREDILVTTLGSHLEIVSQQTCEFYNVTSTYSAEFVTCIESSGLRNSVSGEQDSGVSFEKRLDALKAYVSSIGTEAIKQQDRKPSVNLVCPKSPPPDCADSIDSACNSGCDSGLRRRCIVRKASNSLRKTRNAVVRQRKEMSKLCAVAARLVSRTETSYQMILNCLKTVAIVLTSAVRVCRLMEGAVREFENEGRVIPAFSEVASVTREWTKKALFFAETLVRLHKDGATAFNKSCWNMDVMTSYHLHGLDVFRNIMAAGDSFQKVAKRPTASLDTIRNQDSNMKLMRTYLCPVLAEMRNYLTLIERWSDMNSDTVPISVNMLCLATHNTCNAIEASTKAVNDILIPFGVSIKGKQRSF